MTITFKSVYAIRGPLLKNLRIWPLLNRRPPAPLANPPEHSLHTLSCHFFVLLLLSFFLLRCATLRLLLFRCSFDIISTPFNDSNGPQRGIQYRQITTPTSSGLVHLTQAAALHFEWGRRSYVPRWTSSGGMMMKLVCLKGSNPHCGREEQLTSHLSRTEDGGTFDWAFRVLSCDSMKLVYQFRGTGVCIDWCLIALYALPSHVHSLDDI